MPKIKLTTSLIFQWWKLPKINFSSVFFFAWSKSRANKETKTQKCVNYFLSSVGVWNVLVFFLSALWINNTKMEYLPLCIHAGLLLIWSNQASRFSAIRLHLWPGHLPLWISCNSFFELNFFHTPWILPSGLWDIHKWHCHSLMTIFQSTNRIENTKNKITEAS